jgi:hypothetical protein
MHTRMWMLWKSCGSGTALFWLSFLSCHALVCPFILVHLLGVAAGNVEMIEILLYPSFCIGCTVPLDKSLQFTFLQNCLLNNFLSNQKTK